MEAVLVGSFVSEGGREGVASGEDVTVSPVTEAEVVMVYVSEFVTERVGVSVPTQGRTFVSRYQFAKARIVERGNVPRKVP